MVSVVTTDQDKPKDPAERPQQPATPLDPAQALRGLHDVDPDEPVAQDEPDKKQGDALAE